ncbi:hypothetical protein PV682_32230 [Streptomyces niveiscabiei]|uniref:hypothetical protein n=1 Tax=Streptomyces niveiscabiei TaxID=164115 RepID=UPI0029B180B0|nr:hypothetical protein [Streptomyces niveiscabiei]MDX3386091.1 hypothetical protein [Streptomyces niveiscabiei]
MDGDLATWPGLPYVLLFLEWEARYPLEWTQHAKAWGTKQGLIREVARARQEAIKAKLADLVEIVVHRAYRCKDREYVRVARAVDSADLRARPWYWRPSTVSGSGPVTSRVKRSRTLSGGRTGVLRRSSGLEEAMTRRLLG